MKSNVNALPASWCLVRLDELVRNPKNDIVDGPFGSNLKASEYISEGTPIIRLQNVTPAQFVEKNIKFVSEDKARSLARHSYLPGDLLVTKLGDPLGEACIVPSDFPPGIIVADIVRIRLHPSLNKSAVMYAINSSHIQDEFKRLTKGTTRPRVNLQHVRAMHAPLLPREEQDRIVAEIEKQFSRLDAATTALKRVQANLKRYRASVLNAACEGRLVPAEAELARKEGREYEPADKLLERILRERRARWEADTLAKLIACGKPPKDDAWKRKYKEPAVPITGEQPIPREGWCWTRIGYAFDCVVPNRDKPKSFTGPIPWLTLPDFTEDIEVGISDSGLGLSMEEVSRYRARLIPEGSVVMSCVGRFGITAVLKFPSVINQQLHAFLIPSWLTAKYFAYALRTQVDYMRSLSTATTIDYLNKDNCNSVPVPLPPIQEQERIAAELDRHFSCIHALETQLDTSLRRLASLRRSILEAAFSGRLTTQDPNDEPASVLLERIRAERSATGSTTVARRRRQEFVHA